MRRPIIEIDEKRCNGCGQCILDCAEGALAIVNGKAKLISEVYCDGLGACLNCPQGALRLVTREAPEFDEAAALQAKTERELKRPLAQIKPGQAVREIIAASHAEAVLQQELRSHLSTWPIQLELMPASADYLDGADLLLAAHCSGFALPDIGRDWLAGRVPIIACPKLENNEKLIGRLARLLAENDIKSLTVLRMSVPCCGLERIARKAIDQIGRELPFNTHVVQMR